MDNNLTTLAAVDAGVIAFIVVYKTILFFRLKGRKLIRRWLYFTRNEIHGTENEHTRLKVRQNSLSLLLLFVVLFTGMVAFILFKA